MDRRNIWVFGMGLSGTPNLAWDAVQASLVAPKDISGLRAAIFPAANELWRFVVTSTLHGIWIESLRRMEFPSLPPEAHNASARTQLRRAITSFRNSTYQPGADDATNNLAYMRSALADTLLQKRYSSWSQPAGARHLFRVILSTFFRWRIARKPRARWFWVCHC